MCEKKNNIHHFCLCLLPVYLIPPTPKTPTGPIFLTFRFYFIGAAFLVHFYASSICTLHRDIAFFFFYSFITMFLTFAAVLA